MNIDTLALIISILAIIVTAIGVWISVVNSMKSDLIATEANGIAKKALEISLFTHQGEVLPELTGRHRVYSSAGKIHVFFSLTNKRRGPALIEQLTVFNDASISFRDRHSNELQFPIEILFNNSVTFLVSGRDWMGGLDDDAIEDQLEFQKVLCREVMKEFMFSIVCSDVVGNRYKYILGFDRDQHLYTGVPQAMR